MSALPGAAAARLRNRRGACTSACARRASATPTVCAHACARALCACECRMKTRALTALSAVVRVRGVRTHAMRARTRTRRCPCCCTRCATSATTMAAGPSRRGGRRGRSSMPAVRHRPNQLLSSRVAYSRGISGRHLLMQRAASDLKIADVAPARRPARRRGRRPQPQRACSGAVPCVPCARARRSRRAATPQRAANRRTRRGRVPQQNRALSRR